MGNSLLDFVMALVRDPETAARFAADPAGTLERANLTGVTVADVENLIPVVTDSLALTTPGFGATAEAGNVWTSGAAAVAFGAFDVSRAEPGPYSHPALDVRPAEPVLGHTVDDRPAAAAPDFTGPAAAPAEQPEDFPAEVWPDLDPWQHQQPDHPPGGAGFEQI